ncbi:hypothetical protein [Mucilaginibacter sp. KACC 22063]|uniref:hypothetical protein n=1 Tax=Mucilaginibacter sp. KACC 22063 TaxID=3025666 RepID=UPI002365D42B|nr:hypothetical protein [Mucilaginibacter sp. KACC 22063]WDF56393.1 hypothetical protein PQ461_04925 [Mucilaginibacter sp. KACC 22063]
MKATFILIVSVLLLSCKANSQQQKNYFDFVIEGDHLVALTDSGELNIFDTKSNNCIDKDIKTDTAIIAVTVNNHNQIIVADANNIIKKYDLTKHKFKIIEEAQADIYSLVCNSKNKIFAVTTEGIEDVATKNIYPFDRKYLLNKQIFRARKPSAVFMDKDDKLWLGYAYGEWGGNLLVFNTGTHKFIKVVEASKVEVLPVKSIFSDNAVIYLSLGLQHMLTSGSIDKITDKKYSTVFGSESHWKEYSEGNKIVRKMDAGEYIGPATFNNSDGRIYFYSQNGLFSGNPKDDLSKIQNWEKITNLQFHWSYGQPDAVGSPMNVLKMQFKNSMLYILTQNDGIVAWDGKAVKSIN